jgi:ketosteroid isomerase-like protein
MDRLVADAEITPSLPTPVRRFLAAYNAVDVDAMLESIADDIVFENVSNSGPTTRTVGKVEFAALARQSATLFASRQQHVVQAVVEPDRVAILLQFEAVVAADMPNGWRSGERVRLMGTSFFQLANGQIARLIDFS